MNINVVKRNGHKEPLDLNKFHKVVAMACEGITGVSASEVELKSHVQFKNGIKSSDIQETLIKAAGDLISEDSPNYQYVAGRLINYHLRKEVYGQYQPIHLQDHLDLITKLGFYDPYVSEKYSKEDIDILNSFIDHERDYLFTFAAMEQWRGKYLVRNRVTNEIYETPQMAFILIAATLFAEYPQHSRMKWVKDYYDAISTFDISLPTPVMAGVRTPQRQFSSCVLIDTDDSLDSINATSSAIVKYVSQKAGIGINVGKIRAINSPIRGGDASHTGLIPFIKYFQAAVKSCSQGGVRGGAATAYFPLWHYEIEDLLVLKNNKGTENNRARHIDYGVQFNRLMYERLISGGNISLFSPQDVPDLYEAFFVDNDKFAELYEKYERSTKIRKKTISALDLFSSFVQERKDTGRIYLMNVDHCNDHGSFIKANAPIRMSNLCAEITLPTVPLNDINDDNGEIALCTLSAINWGKIKKPEDFEKPCTLAVRGLDALLSFQDFPVKAGSKSTQKYRPLGVGINNLAYWMAKNDMTYTDPDLEKIHEFTEAWSYYLIKASVQMAAEFGPMPAGGNVWYDKGVFPIDTYKKDVDTLVPNTLHMDWDTLREDAQNYGIRNATLMACMPSETSSLIINSTNGVEPPRAFISVKQSKDAISSQVVPEYRKLKNKYELLWDQKNPEGYLKVMAVLQKFIDQSISVNTSYNPSMYEKDKIPTSEMIGHILNFYKMGGKTLYYCNTADGQGEIPVETDNPVDEILDDDDSCDSCKI